MRCRLAFRTSSRYEQREVLASRRASPEPVPEISRPSAFALVRSPNEFPST